MTPTPETLTERELALVLYALRFVQCRTPPYGPPPCRSEYELDSPEITSDEIEALCLKLNVVK